MKDFIRIAKVNYTVISSLLLKTNVLEFKISMTIAKTMKYF